jgi:hypothetical protein
LTAGACSTLSAGPSSRIIGDHAPVAQLATEHCSAGRQQLLLLALFGRSDARQQLRQKLGVCERTILLAAAPSVTPYRAAQSGRATEPPWPEAGGSGETDDGRWQPRTYVAEGRADEN